MSAPGHHQRTSLTDTGEKPTSDKPAGKGGGMSPQDRIKAIVAVAVIVASGVGLAAYYGVFSTPEKDLPTIANEEGQALSKQEQDALRKQMEEQEQEAEELVEEGVVEKASAG
jgi:uncharacterized membrane protein